MSKKIVIVGGGLSALSAGIKLLEMDKGYDVTIYNMGHHLGGKAGSYMSNEGYEIDHGFHAIFKTYHAFLHLLKKAGVIDQDLISNKKRNYFFETDSQQIHYVGELVDHLAKKNNFIQGYGFGNNLAMADFYFKNRHTILKDKDIEYLDEVCYTAWAIKNGYPLHLINKTFFRYAKDGLFNWPNEISAYMALKSVRLIGEKREFYFVNGHYGTKIINPIVEYYKKLGGKIESYKKLIKVDYDDTKAVKLVFRKPNGEVHNNGFKHWDKEVVTESNDIIVTNFDAVILTLPVDSFRELNKGDQQFFSYFKGIENLQSICTLSYQVYTKEKLIPYLGTTIDALPEPFNTVVDYKDMISQYKDNPEIGSALIFGGQETKFEKYTDEELKQLALNSLKRLPIYVDKPFTILYDCLNRNSSHHERYLLTDPGTLKYRPVSKTFLTNMFLAGDWIRNPIDVPTMEGAVISGYQAAKNIENSFK